MCPQAELGVGPAGCFFFCFLFFHHLQPADPASNPACGHMTSPLTLQEVPYLSMFSRNEGRPPFVHVAFYSFQSNLFTHLYSNQV